MQYRAESHFLQAGESGFFDFVKHFLAWNGGFNATPCLLYYSHKVEGSTSETLKTPREMKVRKLL